MTSGNSRCRKNLKEAKAEKGVALHRKAVAPRAEAKTGAGIAGVEGNATTRRPFGESMSHCAIPFGIGRVLRMPSHAG